MGYYANLQIKKKMEKINYWQQTLKDTKPLSLLPR